MIELFKFLVIEMTYGEEFAISCHWFYIGSI